MNLTEIQIAYMKKFSQIKRAAAGQIADIAEFIDEL